MTADLAVVVVAHDAREDVLALLTAIEADPDRDRWEVVVLDNESADGTFEAVCAAHPNVRAIRNVPQRGFAAAANQGIALTTAPVVALVNPDCRLPAGALSRLGGVLLSDPRIGAAGPLFRFPDGAVQRHGMFRPRPLTALVVLTGLHRLPFLRGEAERYYGRHEAGPPQDVEQLTGACLLLRRQALREVGPFDERFFVYCEDVDWGLRATAAGWRLVFAPEVEVIHAKAATTSAKGAWAIRTYYSSVRKFYEKHHAADGPLRRAAWRTGVAVQERLALLRLRVRGRGLSY